VIAGIDQIGREAARQAARDELHHRRYSDAQPPLLARVVGRIIREVLELIAKAATGVPGGRLGLLVLLALLGLLVAVVFAKLGRPGRSGGGASVFSTGRALTAAEHRERAEQAAARGEWAEAVRERLRAVVRELEARGVIEPRPGRTAGEVARDGGAALPALSADLRRGATVFDEVWYGGRTADASSYAVLVAVDNAVTSARLITA
jgi:hypothetical protein